MRILIADSFPTSHTDRLVERGHEVVHEPTLGAEDLPASLAGFDALVVRSTRVTAAAIEAGRDLSLIIRAGAGTNTIDVDAAAAHGIYVLNVPGKNAIAVAELTMGLILALDRNIPDNVAELRAGRWDKKRFSKADGLAGKTLGIVGLGAIGLEVARRASGFGLRALAVADPSRPADRVEAAERAGVEWVPDRDSLLSAADIVTFHVPLTEETRGMIDASLLGRMREGAWVINTSRGELVVEADLLDALDRRGMRAGLDVFPDEPAASQSDYRSALASHPQVYGTHHIGASTEQAQIAVADGVLGLIADYRSGVVRNCVNLEAAGGLCSLSVRHLDRVGVLSEVLGVLKEADINVGQMENRVFRGSVAAVANIRVDSEVPDEVVERIAAVEHVLGVRVNREV